MNDAHLILDHKWDWFYRNNMGTYGTGSTSLSDSGLDDDRNIIRLRSDIHTAFDAKDLILFPKTNENMAVHVQGDTPDLCALYHNCEILDPSCAIQCLFARFAWCILVHIIVFIKASKKERRAIRWDENQELGRQDGERRRARQGL